MLLKVIAQYTTAVCFSCFNNLDESESELFQKTGRALYLCAAEKKTDTATGDIKIKGLQILYIALSLGLFTETKSCTAQQALSAFSLTIQ